MAAPRTARSLDDTSSLPPILRPVESVCGVTNATLRQHTVCNTMGLDSVLISQNEIDWLNQLLPKADWSGSTAPAANDLASEDANLSIVLAA